MAPRSGTNLVGPSSPTGPESRNIAPLLSDIRRLSPLLLLNFRVTARNVVT
jgi:hypothetical protein